ncbi:hypothetical protein [Petrocella sp. FN5]|uniref:hypothetical protein n=1 Tax=Petrocella sp. FN5 TaxID=3032002 RepID=UPI0023DC2789|nr:hypothetical protein [Petrocella sp. FN5]MDF1618100.1 hypothetical protein [Petrocella sp. FN5]
MKITKKVLGQLERVYATTIMEVNGRLNYIVASEGVNQCIAYDAESLAETVVWEEPGGTMNIVPIPGRPNEFYATQKFAPTFNAQESRIVHGKANEDNSWTVTPVMTIPYLHRFDLLLIEDALYLIGGVLCKSKAFLEDWSDPGCIIVGKLEKDITQPFKLTTIYDGITKNHGFYAGEWKNRKAYLITGVEGVFAAYVPNNQGESWEVERILDFEVSDCSMCDIDGDGQLELATIEKFHGELGKIYKEINGKWEMIHSHKYEFGHVVWGGKIQDEPAFIIGGRKGDMELILFTMDEKGQIQETLIDHTGGPSNIDVINLDNKDVILAANRQIGEVAIYEITKN